MWSEISSGEISISSFLHVFLNTFYEYKYLEILIWKPCVRWIWMAIGWWWGCRNRRWVSWVHRRPGVERGKANLELNLTGLGWQMVGLGVCVWRGSECGGRGRNDWQTRGLFVFSRIRTARGKVCLEPLTRTAWGWLHVRHQRDSSRLRLGTLSQGVRSGPAVQTLHMSPWPTTQSQPLCSQELRTLETFALGQEADNSPRERPSGCLWTGGP